VCEGSPTRAACCSHRSPSRSAPTRRCARWHVHVCRVTTVDHCECCGRRLARGRRRDLSALRTLAPATLLVLVLLLVLAVASRSCSSCCANHRQLLHLRDAKWSPAARRLGRRCSRTFGWARLTASSSSARPPRPPTHPRLHNAEPAHILAHCPPPAPRARASRRACLVSADASRRDVQNLPRRISPRDGSREHGPRTWPSLSASSVCPTGQLTHTHARGPARGADAQTTRTRNGNVAAIGDTRRARPRAAEQL